jgi:hypothetical protein
MQRRSSAQSGWVNFPTEDPAWANTQAGGMLVKLVVCDNRVSDEGFGLCCGASVTDLYNESFIGDDRRPIPSSPAEYESVEADQAHQSELDAWEAYHYPRIADLNCEQLDRFLSRSYRAVLVVGVTGWSGWNESTGGRYWQCTFDDLTPEGKTLYQQVQALYPGCELHLLTFLDT